MKRYLFIIYSLFSMAIFAAKDAENPFFSKYETPYGAPPFDKIQVKHYMPAFLEGIKQHTRK